MRVEGIYHLPAGPESVWDLLMDPAFLKEAIPGCEELAEEGDRTYRVRIELGVGPIDSTFTGHVRLNELRPPQHCRMETTAEGLAGSLNGSAGIDLAGQDGGTEVRYSGEMQVSGMIDVLGSRMIERVFRKSVEEFFGRAGSRLREQSRER